MYPGEYDVCDVTLSVYPHRASLKNMPGHGGNRTYDLRNTSPMLCQLSYAVRSVRVCDISELRTRAQLSEFFTLFKELGEEDHDIISECYQTSLIIYTIW